MSHALASASRWLVGSSSSSTSLPANRMRASSTRRRSPPDSTWSGRSSRSAARPRPAARLRASAVGRVAAVVAEALLGPGIAGHAALARVLLQLQAELLERDGRLVQARGRDEHVAHGGRHLEQAGQLGILGEVAEGALAYDGTGRRVAPRRRAPAAGWSCRRRCDRPGRPCRRARTVKPAPSTTRRPPTSTLNPRTCNTVDQGASQRPRPQPTSSPPVRSPA